MFLILFITDAIVTTAYAQSIESRNHIFIREQQAIDSWFGNSITLGDRPQ